MFRICIIKNVNFSTYHKTLGVYGMLTKLFLPIHLRTDFDKISGNSKIIKINIKIISP